jgi:hypothetical protein
MIAKTQKLINPSNFVHRRDALHKLQEFTDWCVSQGWIIERPKGEFEVLRMRHPGQSHPLIINRRDKLGASRVHYITWGISEAMRQKWMRQRRTP